MDTESLGLAAATNDLIEYLALIIEIAHYILIILGVRSDWNIRKARQQPLATWLMSLACCFGGGMLCSIAVGNPAITPLSDTQSVMLMTIVWWHVFYSPWDVFYSIVTWKPAIVMLAILKEMIRTRKIIKGVKLGRATFPNSLLICTFLGMLSACGGGFLRCSAIFIRNKWDHNSVRSVYFSLITKFSLLFSLLYNVQLRGELGLEFNTVVLLQFITMSIFAVRSKVGISDGISDDPFRPIENLITSIVVDYSAFGIGYVEILEKKKKMETISHSKRH